MKVIILSEAEDFCREHNFQMIGIQTLREMAIEKDDDGIAIAYKAGYAHCNQAVIKAMAEERP
jgi:hypothetical protein